MKRLPSHPTKSQDKAFVAKRERLYSRMAMHEKRLAQKDLSIAKKKHMKERIKDDKREIKICDQFAKKRIKWSKQAKR